MKIENNIPFRKKLGRKRMGCSKSKLCVEKIPLEENKLVYNINYGGIKYPIVVLHKNGVPIKASFRNGPVVSFKHRIVFAACSMSSGWGTDVVLFANGVELGRIYVSMFNTDCERIRDCLLRVFGFLSFSYRKNRKLELLKSTQGPNPFEIEDSSACA